MFFFFNDTATTEIYTLSLHDALPISHSAESNRSCSTFTALRCPTPKLIERPISSRMVLARGADRKSTRLNSSHLVISYAVFCLKKKNTAWHFHGHSVLACLAATP